MSDFGGGAPPPPPPPSAGGGGPIPQRGLGDILSTAFELYKTNFAKLIQLVAMVVIPLALIQAFLVTVAFKPCDPGDVDTLQELSDAIESCSGTFGRSLLVGALTWFIAIAIQQLLLGALTRGGAGAVVGRPVDVNASYKYAFSRLGGLIGLALLIAIVVGVGFLLLIIPGIIFAVFLAMAVPSFIIERKGVTESMSRSWQLVRNHWWHTLVVIFVASLLAGIVNGILTALGGDNFILYWIFSTIGLLITAPFVALVAIVLYVDLRSRHEGLTAEGLGAELDAATA